jgi:hypothetical protein
MWYPEAQRKLLSDQSLAIYSPLLQVAGRILVDYFGYEKHQNGNQRTDTGNKKSRKTGTNQNDAGANESAYINALPKEQQEENQKEMLGDREDDLVFVSPLLKGFSLKNKLWRTYPPKLRLEARV